MPYQPIRMSAPEMDLSGRVAHSETVAASPAAATETTIATVTIPLDCQPIIGVFLMGWAAYTVGTSGTAVTLKLRQTDTSGSTKASTGALTKTAASLYADDVSGFDSAPPAAGVYVLTMTVTSGAAASTVSAVQLIAWVI